MLDYIKEDFKNGRNVLKNKIDELHKKIRKKAKSLSITFKNEDDNNSQLKCFLGYVMFDFFQNLLKQKPQEEVDEYLEIFKNNFTEDSYNNFTLQDSNNNNKNLCNAIDKAIDKKYKYPLNNIYRFFTTLELSLDELIKNLSLTEIESLKKLLKEANSKLDLIPRIIESVFEEFKEFKCPFDDVMGSEKWCRWGHPMYGCEEIPSNTCDKGNRKAFCSYSSEEKLCKPKPDSSIRLGKIKGGNKKNKSKTDLKKQISLIKNEYIKNKQLKNIFNMF
jgi:hypothetical protein